MTPAWRRPQRRRGSAAATPPTAAGLPAPLAIEAAAAHVRVDQTLCRTLAVIGYPREVGPGWLSPILDGAGAADVTLHIEPIPNTVAADRLRRQLARLESTRRITAGRERLADPEIEVAAEDARDLADRVARGEGRLFRVGLAVTVRARTLEDLETEADRVRALLASLLLDARPATYRALQGWLTTLPLGLDALRLRRTLDTAALAASFPFALAELPAPSSGEGVVLGRSANGRGVVQVDRWGQPNYNAVILARSGAGKSFLAKIDALRSLYRGVEVLAVDPDGEYQRMTERTGGAWLPLGTPQARINPFDLDHAGGSDAVTRRALFAHTLVTVLLGARLSPDEQAALDRAILAAYAVRGITADVRTHHRQAPLLADLTAALGTDPDPAAALLARRLQPFATGNHRVLFDGPSTGAADRPLTVFSLRTLPDELKTAGTLLALDAIWRRVTNPHQRRQRLVVLDEAWTLMRDPEGARYVHRLAKAARKHWAGLTTVTQDAADLLDTSLGQAVVANASVQILLGQAPQAMPRLAEAFRLTQGEQQFLLAADLGEGVIALGPERAAVRIVASDRERELITTNPAELAAQAETPPIPLAAPRRTRRASA